MAPRVLISFQRALSTKKFGNCCAMHQHLGNDWACFTTCGKCYSRTVFLNPESPDLFESAEGSGWVRKH